MKHSYGVLLHRYNSEGKLEVFLGHANGPRYWPRKHDRKWGLPKGRADKGELALETALREFAEEVGIPAPDIKYKKLFKYATPHQKRITVFTGNAQGLDVEYGGSMMHRIEWPVGSGEIVEYPEMDTAGWFTQKKALKRVMWGQKGILQHFFAKEKARLRKKAAKAARVEI